MLELAPERRRRAVAGVDAGLGTEALEQARDRVEQRLPVAAREVDAAHRVGEEQIAGEDRPVGRVGDVAGGVPRHADHLELDPAPR